MEKPMIQKKTLKTLNHYINDKTLVICLNRPKRLNAFNSTMLHEILTTIEMVDSDDDICAVIFTGEGKYFCAGADLSEDSDALTFSSRTDKINGIAPDEGGMLALRLYDFKKPIICAVNGAAVGIGATMQLPMDVRIASSDAKFGFVFSKRGLVPEACSSWFLPRIVGISQALQWCFHGEVFGADEALRGGLITEITAPEDLLPRALAIANRFTKKTSQVSLALTRQMLWKMMGSCHPLDAHQIDSRGIQLRRNSADGEEGIRSFLEKRDSNFQETVSENMPPFYPWWENRKFE